LGRIHPPPAVPKPSRSPPRYSLLLAILDARQFLRNFLALSVKLVMAKLLIQLHSQSAAPAASF
jgi:hypothetical protein